MEFNNSQEYIRVSIYIPDGDYCGDCHEINDWGYCVMFQCELEGDTDNHIKCELCKRLIETWHSGVTSCG